MSALARLVRLAGCLRPLLLGAALLGATGCGPEYDHTTIDNVKPSPLGGSVSLARIEVPVGMIVTSHIVSYNDKHDTMAIDLHTKDSSIVDVANVISEHDYAFLGLKPGETDVELRANGDLVLVFHAVVVAQPTPP